jgi:hypothetical protein
MTRLVDRVAGVLERRIDRRSVLVRAAVGGAALAVAPLDFTLRPGTAYARVCRCAGPQRCDCGARCCDGSTEFCCTVYGANRCPPGSVVAGWWKADGTAFCGGGPRYYMDCNATCGDCGCGPSGLCAPGCSNVACACAFGDCDHWRINCVSFRYGQCNQQVACVGPITCRVVTCVPPWEIEPSCTTTVAVDQGTRSHNAPCLTEGRGSIDVLQLDRRSLRVAGWALDASTATSLTIQYRVDGALVHTSAGSLNRPDLAPYFPGLGTAHGFDARFDVPPGYHTLSVEAFAPDAPIDRFVVGTRSLAVGIPFGAVDLVKQVPGGLDMAGWVIDPDSTQRSPVHVYVDGTMVASTTTQLPRPDVAAVFPGFGTTTGWSVFVPAVAGVHTVCAYAINLDDPGLNQLLACRTVTLRGAPLGALDRAERAPGGVRVAGWAFDPQTAGVVDVHVYVDGTFVTAQRADLPRTDIAQYAPPYGAAHGFDFVVPVLPGRRDVCVYAIDANATGDNPMLGCSTVAVASAPLGALDAAPRVPQGVRVVGWALDPDTAAPVAVHVYVDGTLVAEVRADEPRPDIAGSYPGYGAAHGFDVVVPASAARHEVCAYAIGNTAGQNVLLACRSV